MADIVALERKIEQIIDELKGLCQTNGLSNQASEEVVITSVFLYKFLNDKFMANLKDFSEEIGMDYKDVLKNENSEIANNVSIKYSTSVTSSYEYDAENKVYKRFVNGKEHKDYVTGEQYTFKNIITYKVKNYNLDDSGNKGRQGLENIGSGKGYFITNGYAVPITWEKTSRESQTVYKYLNGEEIIVNDGNTFIQIQPTGQELSIS